MVLCDAAVLLRGRRDNTGSGELIAVETASFVHSDEFNRDSAQLCAAVVVKTGFYPGRERKNPPRAFGIVCASTSCYLTHLFLFLDYSRIRTIICRCSFDV